MENKMLYCKKCKRYRGFYKKDKDWCCVGCKSKIPEKEVDQTD